MGNTFDDFPAGTCLKKWNYELVTTGKLWFTLVLVLQCDQFSSEGNQDDEEDEDDEDGDSDQHQEFVESLTQ